MFIYLVIAVELAILYTIFWYVFVKEPKACKGKPYKFSGNPWGKYADLPVTTGSDNQTVCEVADHVPQFIRLYQNEYGSTTVSWSTRKQGNLKWRQNIHKKMSS